jgi:serine/threonine protein phosphatase 1
MSTFAVSDIHGCYRTFEALLQRIGLDKDDELFLLEIILPGACQQRST